MNHETTSDTPETDAAKRRINGMADEWVPRYVSEQLERERDEARNLFESSKRARASLNEACDHLQRERDRLQKLAEANGKLAHSSACEAMDYRRERDDARASLVAAEAWSATLADVGDDFRAANAELRAAIRNMRDVKGEHRTQIACERLFALLPENDKDLARRALDSE